jgi:hypothetical protein
MKRFLYALLGAAIVVATIGRASGDDPRDGDVSRDMAGLKAAMMDQAKHLADRFNIASFQTTKPFHYYRGKDNEYVIVPTRAVLTLEGKTIEDVSCMIGVKSPADGTWHFVCGAGTTCQMLSTFFPDLPAAMVLPNHTVKLLN